MAYIEFDNVCKKYKNGESEIYALDHISFTVEKGELCVIVGPSGAGKTTLLNALSCEIDHHTARRLRERIDGELFVYKPRLFRRGFLPSKMLEYNKYPLFIIIPRSEIKNCPTHKELE